MKKIIFVSVLLTNFIFYAQLPQNILTPTQRVTDYDEYEGTVYLKTQYKEASVIDEKLGTIDAKLKYNIFTDALEYKEDKNLYNVYKTPTVHARIDGDYFYYCEFKSTRGTDRSGYYVLVELNDQYRIYKKYTLKIKDPLSNEMTHTQYPGELRTVTTYYLEENNKILELPLNKKELLASFSDKEEELKSYLKKEKIRFRKEEDLIRLIAKYNALKIDNPTQTRSLLSNVEKSRR